jgi:hypothetical protein
VIQWDRTDPNIITSRDRLFKIARRPQNGVEVYMLRKLGDDGKYHHLKTSFDESELKLDAEEMEFLDGAA